MATVLFTRCQWGLVWWHCTCGLFHNALHQTSTTTSERAQGQASYNKGIMTGTFIYPQLSPLAQWAVNVPSISNTEANRGWSIIHHGHNLWTAADSWHWIAANCTYRNSVVLDYDRTNLNQFWVIHEVPDQLNCLYGFWYQRRSLKSSMASHDTCDQIYDINHVCMHEIATFFKFVLL